ncbi:Pre-rRNA-processing protein ESF2 [Xylariaceae sp. FL0255]|nr:Pre-rRNA-processing protein ESF2 [Xylariaceae sp. FL0255]
MPAEKRNHFLDADESDDDAQGYASEADELLQKGKSKRRKLDSDQDTDLESDQEIDDNVDQHSDEETENKPTDEDRRLDSEAEPALEDISRPLTKKNLVATEKAIKRSGVVYISRIPPFMKPNTVRKIFERFGKINRVYLAAEDAQVRARRIKQGQNRKKNYNEGWLEYVKKSDAKAAVDVLNGTTLAAIGAAKKGSYYRDDIWSLRYLKGFKWHNLTEQIAAETAERQSRMRAEISKATKENKEFVRNIQKAKELEGIQTKAAAKRKRDEGTSSAKGEEPAPSESKSLRKFTQSAVGRKGSEKTPEAAKRVLSKLF